MIQSISSSDVHRITSGQVITDLVSVTKELAENSIDAHSSQIEVTFFNYGVNSVQIVDNGDGINEVDFDKICLKHNTSKLTSFENIVKTKTLGFRGEAMSSLCAVSELSLITSTQQTYPKANLLEFNSMGKLVKNTPQSGKKGTSITIANLFANLPVRKKDFEKNFKREFNKCISNLTNYAIIYPQVRFTVFNVSGKNNKKNLILSTQGGERNTIAKNMVSIFGVNGNNGLVPFDIETPDIQLKFKLKNAGELPTSGLMKLKFVGVISNSSFGMGRLSTDRQFFFINYRPVVLKSFSKCINEVYRSFNSVQYPTVVFNLIIDNEFLDINVTPDKRTVMIHNEETVVEVLREELNEFFGKQGNEIPRNFKEGIKLESEPKRITKKEPQQQKLELQEETQRPVTGEDDSLFVDGPMSSDTELMNFEINDNFKITTYEPKVQKLHVSEKDAYDEEEQVQVQLEEDDGVEDVESVDEVDEDILDEDEAPDGDEVEQSHAGEVTPPAATDEVIEEQVIAQTEEQHVSRLDQTISNNQNVTVQLFAPESTDEESPKPEIPRVEEYAVNVDLTEEKDGSVEGNIRVLEKNVSSTDQTVVPTYDADETDISPHTSSTNQSKRKHEDDHCCERKATKIGTLERPTSKHRSSVHNLKSNLEIDKSTFERLQLLDIKKEQKNPTKSLSKKQIDDITKKTEAEEKLTLTVLKSDFLKMKIIGQFNLGFILVTRPPTSDKPFSDLFIIDQHASDEKFNFEKLQSTTVFQSQPLVSPQTIELPSIDELLVLENIDIFRKNGFNIKFYEEEDPGERVKLFSLPLLKRTVFDLSDFHEIIHLIKERDNIKSTVRCSKIRSMFALRACRSSIMIGQSLKRSTMERVVHNLAGLDKPWNCPHGRPTMRHLMELNDWKSFDLDYEI